VLVRSGVPVHPPELPTMVARALAKLSNSPPSSCHLARESRDKDVYCKLKKTPPGSTAKSDWQLPRQQRCGSTSMSKAVA